MVLELENIEFKVDKKKILDNLSLKIKKKQVYCIVGKNGAGKSSLSKIIMGVTKSKGTIMFKGEDITKLKIIERAKLGISIAWQKPVNIGPIINTEFDEIGVSIHPDGKTLFFSSEGHNSIGKHDIFISSMDEKGQWSKPVNLGFPINSTKDEIHFVLSASKDKAYISSTREEGLGMVDIYEVDMSEYFKSKKNIPNQLAEKFTSEKLSILRGSIVDSDSGKPIIAQVKITSSKTDETIIVHSKSNGNYFTTLPSGNKYTVTVISKGYKSFSFKIKMNDSKTGGTPSTTKHIILSKQ